MFELIGGGGGVNTFEFVLHNQQKKKQDSISSKYILI